MMRHISLRLVIICLALAALALLPATGSVTTPRMASAAVEGPPYDPTCSDNIDNDADTRIDLADPNCVYSSELYLSTPNFPVNLNFAADGRLFYNERCGSVRVITAAGALLPTPFVTIPNVNCSGDQGLTGLAFDPDYATNHYIYLGYTKQISIDPAPRVYQPFIERYTDVNNVGTNPTMIISNLHTKTYVSVANPGDRHSLNNIHFGPDGKLYISIGDYWQHALTPPSSQDLSKPIGKLLRVNKEDGSAPADNPFFNTPGADQRIFAYGLRNSYDFAFHPENGSIYMTENGPESCDELNLIVAGGNYEWPYGFQWTEPPSEGEDHPVPIGPTCEGGVGIPAIRYFVWDDNQAHAFNDNSTTSPVGILPIDGDQFPALGHSLFVCTYRNIVLRHMTLTGAALDDVGQDLRAIDDNLTACLVDIAMSPGGEIYFTQSASIRRLIIDSDADTVEDNDDNCDLTVNLNQANRDLDSFGDACDPDIDGDGIANGSDAEADGDGVMNTDEAACGGDSLDSLIRPERLDGQFDNVSDDGDAPVDEALPPGTEAFDCDGDGWKGNEENLIYGDTPSTARDQDPCGGNGWPADLAENNIMNIADIGSFLTPARTGDNIDADGTFNYFNHALDDDGDTVIETAEAPNSNGGADDPPTYNVRRWDLQINLPYTGTTQINIGDLGALITGGVGSPARPPMFGGELAFFTNGGECPWAP